MKLKRLLIYVVIFLFASCFKVYASGDSDYISGLEQNLFGAQFKNEVITKRLDRIEISIFGHINKYPVKQRIRKIKDVMPGPKIDISEAQTNASKPQTVKLPPTESVKPKNTIKQDPDIKYPAITEIESKVLKQTFENEDIYKRLDRLKKSFLIMLIMLH